MCGGEGGGRLSHALVLKHTLGHETMLQAMAYTKLTST